MKSLHSLVLLSVGSLALSLCSVAAHADSIPTLTATSISFCNGCEGGFNQWTISGDSFSLSGGGGSPEIIGQATPGQPIASNTLDPVFGTTFGGSSGLTFGNVTLDGVTHFVLLAGAPQFVFQPGFIYNPSVTGTSTYPGATVATVSATIFGNPTNNQPIAFEQDFCGSNLIQPSCLGSDIAGVYIDVPGIATINGFQYQGDPFDTITSVYFTSTPEPQSAGLAVIGIAAMLVLFLFKKRILQ